MKFKLPSMTSKTLIFQIIITLSAIIFLHISYSTDFNYPAVFNFGDSNSDTGELGAGLGFNLNLPNGRTFFKSPTGRFCDGRLIVDFLSKFSHTLYLNVC